MVAMKRRSITILQFEGISSDVGLVFKALVFPSEKAKNWSTMFINITSYESGTIEVFINCTEGIFKVAELISGMFSKYSNCKNIKTVIFNYRNLHLQVENGKSKEDITEIIVEAMSKPDYKNNCSHVDMKTCQQNTAPGYEIYDKFFKFEKIDEAGRLWFRNPSTKSSLLILKIKNGVIDVNLTLTSAEQLRKIFDPCSNFYGVKVLEVHICEFLVTVNKDNLHDISVVCEGGY